MGAYTEISGTQPSPSFLTLREQDADLRCDNAENCGSDNCNVFSLIDIHGISADQGFNFQCRVNRKAG